MSTRCMIGYTFNGQSATAVYCHNDGYPSNTGMLLLGYKTLEEVQELVKMGAMSSLGLFPLQGFDRQKAYLKGENSFDNLLGRLGTVYYYGSQAEEVEYGPVEKVMCGCDYAYLFNAESNMWYVRGGAYSTWTTVVFALVDGIRKDINYNIPVIKDLAIDYANLRPRLVKKAPWLAQIGDKRLELIETHLLGLYSTTCYDNITFEIFYNATKSQGIPTEWKNKIDKVDWGKGICSLVNLKTKQPSRKIAITELVKFATFGIPHFQISNPAVLKNWDGWSTET